MPTTRSGASPFGELLRACPVDLTVAHHPGERHGERAARRRAGDPRNLFPTLLGSAVERVAAEQYLVRPFRDPLAKRTGKLRG